MSPGAGTAVPAHRAASRDGASRDWGQRDGLGASRGPHSWGTGVTAFPHGPGLGSDPRSGSSAPAAAPREAPRGCGVQSTAGTEEMSPLAFRSSQSSHLTTSRRFVLVDSRASSPFPGALPVLCLNFPTAAGIQHRPAWRGIPAGRGLESHWEHLWMGTASSPAPEHWAAPSGAQGSWDPANLSGSPKSNYPCSLQTPRFHRALFPRLEFPFPCIIAPLWAAGVALEERQTGPSLPSQHSPVCPCRGHGSPGSGLLLPLPFPFPLSRPSCPAPVAVPRFWGATFLPNRGKSAEGAAGRADLTWIECFGRHRETERGESIVPGSSARLALRHRRRNVRFVISGLRAPLGAGAKNPRVAWGDGNRPQKNKGRAGLPLG